MVKKSVRKICFQCHKPISMKAGAWVLLGTYNRPSKPDHEAYFHFTCFVDNHNEKVREKAFGLANQQNQIISLVNNLAGNILEEISFSLLPSNEKGGKKPMVAKKKSTSKKPQVNRGKNEKAKSKNKRQSKKAKTNAKARKN